MKYYSIMYGAIGVTEYSGKETPLPGYIEKYIIKE
jgi:hypothetical protein